MTIWLSESYITHCHELYKIPMMHKTTKKNTRKYCVLRINLLYLHQVRRIMNSEKHIKLLTFSAIILIVVLQGIWMHNLIQLIERHMTTQINETFKASVNKELMMRRDLVVDSTTNEIIGVVEDNFDEGFFSGPELVYQEFLIKRNRRMNLATIDSIFHLDIKARDLYGRFFINHIVAESGEILGTTDPKGKGSMKGAFRSELIPVRLDKSEGLQVLLVSPYRTIFRQMLFILILSVLLILFVGYTFFYLLRSFIKERHIRQLQNDFSHALTHDMATPLQAIAQVNHLLVNEKIYLDPIQRNKYFRLAQQQILNLQALTDRILTLARAEQAQLTIEPEMLNLNEIVFSLMEKFKIQAKKDIRFTTHFLPGEITFLADPVLIQNAISNLMDNAIKYSTESVNIEIRCEQKEEATIICIKDDGYGISKKEQEKIFAKFERGKAVQRNEARGFGLGLSYVKKVMEAHGGTIGLFSEEGVGSEFVLFVPASAEEAVPH